MAPNSIAANQDNKVAMAKTGPPAYIAFLMPAGIFLYVICKLIGGFYGLAGFNYYNRGDYKDALPHFIALNWCQPDNTDTMSHVGQCYLYTKDYQRAIQYLNQTTEYDPADIFDRIGLGEALLHEGNLTAAREQWSLVVSLMGTDSYWGSEAAANLKAHSAKAPSNVKTNS